MPSPRKPKWKPKDRDKYKLSRSEKVAAFKDRQCGSKKRFRTRAAAVEAAVRIFSEIGEDLEPYPCHFCKWIHLGHKKRNTR